MSTQTRGRDSTSALGNIQDVGSQGAALTTAMAPDIGGTGSRNALTTFSGALTAITAYTSSAGHLYSFQNATATAAKLILVHRIRATFVPTVMTSSAQEFGFAIYQTTAHTAQPTGGAAVTMTSPAGKMRTSLPVSEAAIYYANSTSVLTAGTYTPKTQPLAQEMAWCLAAGATVQFPRVELDVDFKERPMVLAQNEGFLVANVILMANSLAGRLCIRTEWSDVPSYGQ